MDTGKNELIKGVLGHVTKVTRTEDGQTFDIKLNERGREFINNIYKKQRFDRNEIVGAHINTEKE